MANAKLGFRILPSPPRPAGGVIDQFRNVASPNVADAMGRFNFMDSGIVSRSGIRVCGPALTVNCRPADNLMVHKALQLAEPGDVVVVTTGGNTVSAVFGGLMCEAASAKGIGGIVVDGAVRDVEELTRLQFPAFSRTVCPGGCDKDGPGEINVPISCGSTVVCPGDLIVGDGDGIAVVPYAHVEDVLELVKQLIDRETARVKDIHAGNLFRPDVDDVLRKKGVIT
jgi:regulator of RNase E activity RraA